jgi:hypothetical protein
LDSNPFGVGLLGSIEGCFELGGWHVVAVAVEPLVVEPVHPRQRGELDLVDIVPAGGVGPVDTLGLVEPVRGLGQRVVEAVGDVPMLGRAPISSSRSVKRTLVYCDPASECVTRPTSRLVPREVLATSSASRTISVFMFAATRQPTIRRLNASTMKHT